MNLSFTCQLRDAGSKTKNLWEYIFFGIKSNDPIKFESRSMAMKNVKSHSNDGKVKIVLCIIGYSCGNTSPTFDSVVVCVAFYLLSSFFGDIRVYGNSICACATYQRTNDRYKCRQCLGLANVWRSTEISKNTNKRFCNSALCLCVLCTVIKCHT